MLPGATPASYDRPDKAEEKQGRIGCEMFAKKGEEFEWMKPGGAIQAAARFKVRESYPGMLRIPDDWWDGAKQKDNA